MEKFQVMDLRGCTSPLYDPTHPYEKFLDAQEYVWEQRLLRLIPDTLILTYHPPTITLGARPITDQLRHIRTLTPEVFQEDDEEKIFSAAKKFLWERFNINLARARRGGSVWYHDHGVLNLYVIAEVESQFPTKLVWRLEEVLYQTLAAFLPVDERDAERKHIESHNFIGVWTGGKKIAAIGVSIESCSGRYISKFGAAVNISPNRANLSMIDPCGISGREATAFCWETSLSALYAEPEFLPAFYKNFSAVFGAPPPEHKAEYSVE